MLTYDLNITLSLFYVAVRCRHLLDADRLTYLLIVHPCRCTLQLGHEESWIDLVVFPRLHLRRRHLRLDVDDEPHAHVLEPNLPRYHRGWCPCESPPLRLAGLAKLIESLRVVWHCLFAFEGALCVFFSL